MVDSWSVHIIGETASFEMESPGLRVLAGDLGTEFGAILEKLESPGVDGFRHRERFRQYKDLQIALDEDVEATGDLYDRESKYQMMEGQLATVIVSILQVRVRWRRVTIENVIVTDRTGPLFGRGAFSSSKHTLWSTWNLRRNQAGERI